MARPEVFQGFKATRFFYVGETESAEDIEPAALVSDVVRIG
jgi:hypothetical protein